MKTRSQEYSQQVYGQIFPLKEAIENEQDSKRKEEKEKAAKQYGSLCHNFPLMVLRSGLSQAAAFVWVKAKGSDNTPYGKFLTHLADLVGSENTNNPAEFQQEINRLELSKYQRHTRKILAATIWYKRFAESILNVKAGDQSEETGGNENDH